MRPTDFSPELRDELMRALRTVLRRSRKADDIDALLPVTERVCSEARRSGKAPEKMIIALRNVYESLVPHDALLAMRARVLFDALLSTCIQAYFSIDPSAAT